MVSKLELAAATEADNKLIAQIEDVKNVVAGVRAVRNSKNIAQKEVVDLQVVESNPVEAFNSVIIKMANLSGIEVVAAKGDGTAAFLVGTTEYAVPLGNLIDMDAEIAKQEAELKHLEGFLAGVMKKLGNERFVANAPEQVVALERKKQSDAETKIAALKESLAKLKK
jgi:valyl-tRNA synthetase